MKRRLMQIFLILAALGIVAGFAVAFYVITGLSNGNIIRWNGKWYTRAGLEKIIPPQYVEVPAKNTPEEVYAKFRQALLDDDIEGALKCMTEKSRGEYGEAFKDKEKLDSWIKRLPEKLTKESESGNFAYYDIDYKTENKNTATFEKNPDGYWEINSI